MLALNFVLSLIPISNFFSSGENNMVVYAIYSQLFESNQDLYAEDC